MKDEFELITNVVGVAFGSYGSLGVLGALSVLVTSAVAIFRTSLIQDVLPTNFKWVSWSPIARTLFVFFVSFFGSILTTIAAGASFFSALPIAITAALAAMGVRKTFKTVKPPKV